MRFLRSHTSILLLIIIVGIGFCLRFINLGTIPNGLYQDETAIGFNAYSILHTHKDEYGVTFPVYFKSFGDQKLPAYIYATSVSIRTFGLNAFAVRFPSALAGSLMVLVLYLLVAKITKNQIGRAHV